MKERGNLHKKLTTGDVNILKPPRLPLIVRRQKHKSKCTCTHACTRNYNFECDWLSFKCDWLIELSDNKLSNNKLSDNN